MTKRKRGRCNALEAQDSLPLRGKQHVKMFPVSHSEIKRKQKKKEKKTNRPFQSSFYVFYSCQHRGLWKSINKRSSASLFPRAREREGHLRRLEGHLARLESAPQPGSCRPEAGKHCEIQGTSPGYSTLKIMHYNEVKQRVSKLGLLATLSCHETSRQFTTNPPQSVCPSEPLLVALWERVTILRRKVAKLMLSKNSWRGRTVSHWD